MENVIAKQTLIDLLKESVKEANRAAIAINELNQEIQRQNKIYQDKRSIVLACVALLGSVHNERWNDNGERVAF